MEKIYCLYKHENLSKPVEMILKHCHTLGDRDAWYECPVCHACSPTASAGTFDENAKEAYELARKIRKE